MAKEIKATDEVVEVPVKLCEVALMIRKDWSKQGTGVNYGARPYLDAMFSLDSIDEKFGYDSGVSIVRYFLANANSWKGAVARAVKKNLNNRCKGK
jgi:hypothetical protein